MKSMLRSHPDTDACGPHWHRQRSAGLVFRCTVVLIDKGLGGGKRAECFVRMFSCTRKYLMHRFLQEGKDEDLNAMPSVHLLHISLPC